MTEKDAYQLINNTAVTYPNPDKQGMWDQAISIALSALQKRIAKKLDLRTGWPEEDRDTADGFCPDSGEYLTCITPRSRLKQDYFCNYCGKRIDWEAGND